jgi:L-ascorbate metabolism protein UlaG (beta-lactamase superfamily)
MKITWVGHAAVLIEASKTILIDPFLSENPSTSMTVDDLPKIDIVLVTHDHFDHLGDVKAVLQRDHSAFFGVYELSLHPDISGQSDTIVGANIGGSYQFGGISISLTPAVHSADSGVPSGYVIKIDDITIYHSGDTALFSDMKLIPQLYGNIDVACLPIGGHYTMDATAASQAVNYLRPKYVIPIHYNTWAPIAANPESFAKTVHSSQVTILQPGEAFEV